ncbi:hypothetical protein QE152_g1950 [Popillia japonica]|uniref:Uncharacterized protein n=1 Tax=Popillia japonica TaxID=7064 RepID=A0AAW1N177_POPJA
MVLCYRLDSQGRRPQIKVDFSVWYCVIVWQLPSSFSLNGFLVGNCIMLFLGEDFDSLLDDSELYLQAHVKRRCPNTRHRAPVFWTFHH